MQRITWAAAILLVVCVNARQKPGEPMTVAEKFRLHVHRTIDFPSIAGIAFGSAIDHAFLIPYDWGGGIEGYGKRFGSALAENAVEQQLQFAVEAIDGEDPRLPHAHGTGFWHRSTSAALTTFYRNSDRGGKMCAYSEFIGAYGAAFISHRWWPKPYNNFANGFIAGSDSVGMDVGMNVLREFMPDIKHALRHHSHEH